MLGKLNYINIKYSKMTTHQEMGPVGYGLKTNFSELSTTDCWMWLREFMGGMPWDVPNLTLSGLQNFRGGVIQAIYASKENPSLENKKMQATMQLQLELCIRRSDELYHQTSRKRKEPNGHVPSPPPKRLM